MSERRLTLSFVKGFCMADSPKLVADNVRADVENLVAETLKAFDGIELVELAFKKEYGNLNLTVYLWKKGGIDLNDCEAVHNALSEKLDTIEQEFPDTYVLNVSSSGLDRKIVTDDDFRRALGTEIEIVKSNKEKPHGILTEYDSEKFTIVLTGKNAGEKTFDRNNNLKVQPYIRF